MIEFEEHFYSDDPEVGHPDVRTKLESVSYFFLGNGLIQAAVQNAPKGEGTPLGLLIMDPERFGPKRDALTLDPDTGLENTLVSLEIAGSGELHRPSAVEAQWLSDEDVPTVKAAWTAERLAVEELFFCPDLSSPVLIREVQVRNLSGSAADLIIRTGVLQKRAEARLELAPGEEDRVGFLYRLDSAAGSIELETVENTATSHDAKQYWAGVSNIEFDSDLLNRFFNAASFQLPAVVSKTGKVDASVWQYNREWVRDSSFITRGLILAGHFDQARRVLARLLDEFVTEEGDTIDSSLRREIEEVELDQNGILLHTLWSYFLWTGDRDFFAKRWGKIATTADYLLRDVFRHKESTLLCNRREVWDRHKAHGIATGIELIYQVYAVIGLEAAASLARLFGSEDQSLRWTRRAAEIGDAVMNHPGFAMHDARGFIKRRMAEGPVQETVTPTRDAHLPDEIPLAADGEHYLNPDTVIALPIALHFIEPGSAIAAATMRQLESLWNQRWKTGGYSRYNVTSEPDSPGPWPFASLFVARACVETGDLDNVQRILAWLATLDGAVSGSWFENYGTRISPPFPQLGIPPWTWSEMLTLLIVHILGIQPEESGVRIRPRLLPGMERVVGSIPLRNAAFSFEFRTEAGRENADFRTSGEVIESNSDSILIAWSNENVDLEGLLPAR